MPPEFRVQGFRGFRVQGLEYLPSFRHVSLDLYSPKLGLKMAPLILGNPHMGDLIMSLPSCQEYFLSFGVSRKFEVLLQVFIGAR